MNRRGSRARRWSVAVAVAVGVSALALAGVGSVSATSSAQTGHPGNAMATTALYAPSGLAAGYAGHTASLMWAAGTNGTGYTILGGVNGASSDCTGVTYSNVATTAGLAYSETRFTPQGNWFCYQVQTSYASWTSVLDNPVVAVRLGFFADTVTVANGGTANRLDTGDTIVINFNQPVATATGPSATNTVCSTNAGVILIGGTATSGSCSAGQTVTVGRLTGGSTSFNGRWRATWVWSNGNQTLTATLGTRVSGFLPVTTSGSFTFNPVTTATRLLSATGSFHVCDTNSGGGLCLPAATGSF